MLFKKLAAAFASLTLLASAPAFSQQLPQQGTPPSGIFLNDSLATKSELRHHESKIRKAAVAMRQFGYEHRNVLRYGVLPMAAISTWYGTYKELDTEVQDEAVEHSHQLKDKAANTIEPFGRAITWVPGFTGVMVYGMIAKDKKAQKAAVCGLGSVFLTGAVTAKLKKTFNRHRPNSGDEYNVWDGPEHATGEHHSFPSSHTSTAFSAATVIATVYKDKPVIPIAAYSLASLVGMSRIYQNHHWASDVLAGAAVGFLCAKTTLATYTWLEKKNLMVYPMLGGKKAGLTATMAF